MTTDPGAVPKTAAPLDSTAYVYSCRRCDAYKPARAHHCSICGRCVVKMDHHCPWVNNCVGIGNHKFFLLFCFYVCLSSIYATSLVVLRFTSCLGSPNPGGGGAGGRGCGYTNHPGSSPGQGVSSLFMVFGLMGEAMLFGLFTLCMLCDQWQGIATGATQIDRLKGEDGGDGTLFENLTEVFGGKPGFSVRWFMPVNACFVDRDELFGYCLRAASGMGGDGTGGDGEGDIELGGMLGQLGGGGPVLPPPIGQYGGGRDLEAMPEEPDTSSMDKTA